MHAAHVVYVEFRPKKYSAQLCVSLEICCIIFGNALPAVYCILFATYSVVMPRPAVLSGISVRSHGVLEQFPQNY